MEMTLGWCSSINHPADQPCVCACLCVHVFYFLWLKLDQQMELNVVSELSEGKRLQPWVVHWKVDQNKVAQRNEGWEVIYSAPHQDGEGQGPQDRLEVKRRRSWSSISRESGANVLPSSSVRISFHQSRGDGGKTNWDTSADLDLVSGFNQHIKPSRWTLTLRPDTVGLSGLLYFFMQL